jgi:hypothetical protein
MTGPPSGYDAARSRREDDDLDRWRFAAEIVEVVLATPSEWSARIGVFGKWGEGKSTVLRFAEQMLGETKNIVFWFNPWAIQNWNDLWEEFGNRLSEALSTAGIPVDSTWLKVAKRSTKWLESSGAGEIAKVGAAALGKDKAVDAAFGLVGRWLKYDGPQIRAIQRKVKQRRLVVLIDDLDRCTPELLPKLLLSLRELLDLPGFTFLLAFDDEIVARALTDNNPAWLNGSNFLEKILDFRFSLPPITEKQKERLLLSAMARYCPFVPKESAKEIQDLLPDSPRKLKTLIRSLAALRPQLVRHDPEELNWVDMWLAQMLRLESPAFVDRLLKDDTLDKEVGSLYRLFKTRSTNGLGVEGQEQDDSLVELIKESGVENPLVVRRLTQLVRATRSRASHMFRYVCELAVRPPAVTWKEFSLVFNSWVRVRNETALANWIKQHAAARYVSEEAVGSELFEAIVNKRQTCLAGAAESTSISEHESDMEQAKLLLEMAEQYILGLGRLGASEFRRIYGQASYWIGWRKNPSDAASRLQEEELLVRLVSSASPSLSTELFEQIYPEPFNPGLDEGEAERKAIRSKCLEIVSERAAKEAITFFARERGIQTLTEAGRFFAVKQCLFDPDSPIWRGALREDLFNIMRRGREDSIIYANVRDLFVTVSRGLQSGIDMVSKDNIVRLLSDREFVGCLWDVTLSRGIQFRMQIAFVRGREAFIQNGAPEELMPLSQELQSRLLEEKSKLGRSRA